jgi:hypothetical protein
MKTTFTRLLFLFCISIAPAVELRSQSISVTEISPELCSNPGTNTFTKTSDDGGTPRRNIYTGIWNGNSAPSEIRWIAANNRWELSTDDAGAVYILWFSTFASRPNPPNLAAGTWTDDGLGCGDLTQFSGTGTQSALVLPVELVSFNARQHGQNVDLSWRTASEQNNAGFHVERSSDGLQWQVLHFVSGNGTTTQAHDYSFSDEKPQAGVNYYRLRQTDFSGEEQLSKVVGVDFSGVKGASTHPVIYPNPVSGDELTLFLPEQAEEDATVSILNPAGQQVYSTTIQASGAQTLDISSLNSGVYWLEVVSGREARQVTKIVVRK